MTIYQTKQIIHVTTTRGHTYHLPGGRLEDTNIASAADCARFADASASFPILWNGAVIGQAAVLGFCSECFRHHFVGTAADGWVAEVDEEGEPLDGEGVAVALIQRHLSAVPVAA